MTEEYAGQSQFVSRFQALWERIDNDYRHKHGKKLTHQQIADCANIHYSTISKWLEKGSTIKPVGKTISRLLYCDKFGITHDDVNGLLEAVREDPIPAGQQLPRPLPPRESLDPYLKQVYRKENKISLTFAMSRNEREISYFPLDQIYIPLRIGRQSPAEDRRRGTSQSKIRTDRLLKAEDASERHLTLLGDAGSGKTTIVRHLAGSLAQARLENAPDIAEQQTGLTDFILIPLMVPLRSFVQHCRKEKVDISLWNFLKFLPAHTRNRYSVDRDFKFFENLLDSGGCLIILDGFDEVPSENDRSQITEMIDDLAGDENKKQNWIILTSRVAAYSGTTHLGGRFSTLWVQHLTPDERRLQVERWADQVRKTTGQKLDAEDILKRIDEGSSLDRLAVTPIVVATLCIVYFHDHELPRERAVLYRRCVDIILGEKHRKNHSEPLPDRVGDLAHKRELLARFAFELHRSGLKDADQDQAAEWIKDGFECEADEKLLAAHKFLEDIKIRGALLQERNGQFGFNRQHLTFQEFLAGLHLSMTMDSSDRKELWPELTLDDRWREPIRLSVGASMPVHKKECISLLKELLNLAKKSTDPAEHLARTTLVAESLVDLGADNRRRIPLDLRRSIVSTLHDSLFADKDLSSVPLRKRIDAATTLGHLGDPRLDEENKWVDIPPGEFIMGGEGEYDGKPQHTLNLDYGYLIGRYPLTNAEFAEFIKAGGYQEKAWWTEAGWKEKENKNWTEPGDWRDSRFNQPNQPVVGVSWYECVAYCRWKTKQLAGSDELAALKARLIELNRQSSMANRQSSIVNRQLDIEVRLPTDAEWEKAAGWDVENKKKRIYPWDDEFDATLVNMSLGDQRANATTPVGLYPGGRSPYGLDDCAGNVWEWLATKWKKAYPYRVENEWAPDYRERTNARVLRGGSWFYDDEFCARCAFRLRYVPDGRLNNYGCRLVVSPIFLNPEILEF